MSVDIARLGLEVRSDGVVVANRRLQGLERQAGRTEGASKRMARQFQDFGRQMRRFAMISGAAMAALSANSLRLAIDAEETANKFRVVFRGSVQQANQDLIKLTETIPLTVTQMRGLAAGIQDMLVPMGVARAEAAGMSTDMVKLAGDLASFNNVPATQVLEAMKSALAGSSEPMRRYGVDTRVARLEQIALRDGLIKTKDEMDNAAMAAATLTAIMEDSSDAAGDAGRTVNSTANQVRFMRRNVNQLQEDLGTQLLPAFNDLLTSLNDNSDGMSTFESSARGVASTVLFVAAGVTMLSAGFVTLAKRIGQAMAISFELIDTFNFDFSLSDLYVPGTGLDKLIDGLRRGASDADGLRERIEEIHRAANEDIQQSENNIFQMFDAFVAGAEALSGTLDRAMEDTEGAASGMDNLGDSTGDAGDAAEDAASKFAELMERQRDFIGGIEEIEAKLSGPSAVALLEYRRSVERANELYGEGAITLKQYTRALDAFGAKLKSVTSQGDQFTGFIDFDFIMSSLDDVKWRMEEIAAIEWDFENLIDSFHPLSAEMRRLGDEIAKIDIALNEGVISQAEAGLARIGATANAAFNAMKSGVDSTSKEYEQLERAQQAINIAMGIAAILQQGMGDPYTAIARMLAVAAMVASLGVDAGNLSGGGSNSAEHRQRTQGTGSVLGDMDAQSESITNAVEITASATSELVGINRGMLRALQSLQSGIVGASGLLARGAGDADFEGVNVPDTGPMPQIFADIGNFLDPIGLFHGIFNAIHKWFGGKAKVIDEGIAILGGTIGELVDGALIAAFQTIKSRQWRFGSSSTDTEFQDLPDDIAAQFSLIFSAITDTVGEAALALGIPLDQIEARMATFRVQAQQISLMDLNAEEQQEALLAVFSQIFDDLAGHVVPFVRDFQEVGEGLGETLVRVANSVQVAQEAFFRLGLSIGEVDPRTMADISVSLVDAIGGLEEFITQMKSFVAAFAPAAHQFNIAQSDIARAMEQVGLAVPDTRDGMWELMQSLDASTEQGREQIATLLRLTETSRRYYDLLDDRNEIQRALLFRLGLGLTGEGFDPVSPVAPPVTITPPDPTPDPTPAPTDPSPPPVGPPDQPGPVLPEPPMDRIQSMQAFVAVLEGTADAADVSSLALQHHLAIIEELGRAGESMVDTFERLHRTVGILDEVMSVGNFTINKSREELIRFGDKLSEIFGDDLAHLGQNFERIMETFFTEDENVSAQADAFRARAASLLADLGIEATDELLTRSGFRDLFDDLFVMFTEAGDAASLAILSEAGAAIADLIDAEAELARIRGESVEAIRDQAAIDDILARMNREIQELGMSQFQIDMRDVGLQAEALRESLLAVGATQEELGIVNEWAEAQTRALIEAERERIDLLTQELLTGLQNTIADLVSSPLRTQLRRIQQAFQDAMRDAFETAEAEQALSLARERQRLQIAALETQLIASIERAQSRLFGDQEMVKPVRRAANNMRDAIIRGLEGVKDWLDRSLLDDLSTLMPEDRLTEARRQFTAAIDRVRAGDMTALADLPRLADQFRAEGSSFFGQTTSDFREIETFVRNAMQSVADQTIVPPEPPTAAQTQEIADNTERLAIEQAQMARQLADELGLLARLQGVAPSEIADRFDIPMGELLELIGVDLPSDVGGELEPMFNDLIREMDAELDAMHQVVRHLDGIIDLGMQHLEVAQHVSDTLERIAGGGIQGTEGFADKKRELDPVAREAIKTIGDRMDRIEGLLRQGNGQRDDHIRMTREGANEVVGANRETTRAVEDLSLPGRNRKATRV